MWLRVSVKDKAMMLNADHILKVVDPPGSGEGRRGAHIYVSLTEYLEVDQSLREMMILLGFEERG
jgi:hypothetical protein